MKILCSISGVEFSCDHFPGTFYSREVAHPIFSIPQKKLLSYTRKWSSGELTPTDSYLMFLALLHSSELIDIRIPFIRTESTDSIISLNMEKLIRTVIKLNTVTEPETIFPHYAVTSETRDLSNVDTWIANWEESYKEFKSGYVSAHDSQKLIIRENALQRMILNPHKKVKDYASQIADWAAVAGTFPDFLIQSPQTKLNVTLSEYWKSIILKAAKNEYLYQIPEKDLNELLEHCEQNIPIGSIFSHALFKLLRAAKEKQDNFLGLGDFDLSKTTYTILSENTSVEAAQLKAVIDAAPLEEPRPEQYPTKFKYLLAKARWDAAQKMQKEGN
jgi:hypothetical protein